ncbi:MAG: methyltransferase domain-containing protein [Candidatus Binatia bacterium]
MAPARRRLSRPARLTLLCLGATVVVGLVATLGAVLGTDAAIRPSPRVAGAGLVVAGATVANLLVRFLRWHFLLRRLGVRQSTMPGLAAYVASFAALPIPLYLGQLYARARLLPLTDVERGRVRVAFVWEHVSDLWALAVLATLAATPASAALALGLSLLLAIPPACGRAIDATEWLARALGTLLDASPAPGVHDQARRLARPEVLAPHLLLSLLAWLPVAVALVAIVWVVDPSASARALAGTAAWATLTGAFSAIPLGAGVAGLQLLHALSSLGVALTAAAPVVFVFRAATAWLSVTLGGLALVLLPGVRRRAAAHDHFDAIDSCYDAWLPPHYRTHLVHRKTAPIIDELATLPRAARGLDIGCGRGWYIAALRGAGPRMTGIDMSIRQLAAAAEHLGRGVPLVQGSVLALPFRNDAFDFAYVINVLHHVAPPAAQRAALAEIARVVRPGGRVFVHEMNVRNPLFRFYLGYVFPILKGIEEGTEYYLDPRTMDDLSRLRLHAVRYFTFVPDFVPAALLPGLARLERRLERSALAPYAAHFVTVHERVEG